MTTDDQQERIRRLERRLERARAARLESEQIAERALRRMYRANELKTVLLGTVNHELRTPATVIRGFADSLLADWDVLDDRQRRGIVERIAGVSEGLSDLVEEVLGLAELEAGEMAARIEPVELAPLVDEVRLEVGRSAMIRSDLQLDVVPAHRPSLRRVLLNLLNNAVAYSPPTSAVVVRSEIVDGLAELSVSDHGPGVPLDDRAQIFEAFYRGHGDHVVRTRGLGVGLTVVQRLVGLHHGEVLVEETAGGGATFVVRLPLENAAVAADDAAVREGTA